MLDFDSFATLLTESYRRLWLIAAAITGDGTEAEDIVQEAAMVALRKLGDFSPESSFVAWMSQIVRMTALNHLRKSARRSTLPTDPAALDRQGPAAEDDPRHPAVGPAGRLNEPQTVFDDDVLRALSAVNDVGRACLLLRVVEQLSYAEIAETLDIPANTAMSHVHRARQEVREQLPAEYARRFSATPGKKT